MAAIRVRSIMPRVSEVSAVCRQTVSERLRSVSSSTSSTPSASAAAGSPYGSWASGVTPNGPSSRASDWPMLPKPTMPTVSPAMSQARNCSRDAQLRAFICSSQ